MTQLGRRIPSDWNHVQKHPFTAPPVTIPTVERTLLLPPLRKFYDQGQEGSCVGFGWSWAMSILNHNETADTKWPKYDAHWLYHQAQLVDEYSDTPPADGTSVRAGGDVLRDNGDVRIVAGRDATVSKAEGILSNTWATTVDEVRQCLANGVPVVIGCNWYENFDHPVHKAGNTYWIGDGDLGAVRGGHCVCVYGASDRVQGVKFVNNWGMSYPLSWMPYDTLRRLLGESGEAAVIVDRK